MENVKMNWVKTPYCRNGGIGITALLAFDCFVKPEIFNLAKQYFEGYIDKGGKKTAVYNSHIITNLMDNGVGVQIDGVNVQKSQYYSNESIIRQSENSTNQQIAHIARIFNEVKRRQDADGDFYAKLNQLFDNKQHIVTKKAEPADIKWELIRVGNVEITFDLNYGVEKRIIYEERTHEDFTPVAVYRSLKLERVPELRKLVEDAKNVKPLIYDEDYQWQPGFDPSTYEGKKKQGYGRR